jgi:probable phosphoglycerate mutase
MGELLVIRHGETSWNRDGIFRGRADVPLSERGREQARMLDTALR